MFDQAVHPNHTIRATQARVYVVVAARLKHIGDFRPLFIGQCVPFLLRDSFDHNVVDFFQYVADGDMSFQTTNFDRPISDKEVAYDMKSRHGWMGGWLTEIKFRDGTCRIGGIASVYCWFTNVPY